MNGFEDNFSVQSSAYRAYRPSYPDGLFNYLRTLTDAGGLAWDCGTGNGQAAIGLTAYFNRIIATDPSKEQIAHAIPHRKIMYKVEPAEASSLRDGSVDLIMVAQAVHWFCFDKFYAEAKRVLKKNGVIAVWSYGLPQLPAAVGSIVRHFHDEVVGGFWQAETNGLISRKYTTLPFPFVEIEAPPFFITKMLTLDEVPGLLYSWSATQKFIKANGFNPVDDLKQSLLQVWGHPNEEKEARWALHTRIGRVR